ncbi:MAG TPA: M28 family peptidase [Gemmatimonadales bacterium]|nr:M28 family peptidase [Gemmatimonadales bacterium]
MRRSTLLLALLSPAATVVAQAPRPARTPAAAAAATITATDVSGRIGIIAHDSMLGRDTPSRGLDLTAQYVADEFQRFGLRPGGDDGTWFQRYAITRRKLDIDSSAVVLRAGGTETRFPLYATARFAQGTVPPGPVAGGVVLFAGPVTVEAAAAVPFQGKVALVVADESRAGTQQLLRELILGGASAVLIPSGLDSASFVSRLAGQARERTAIDLAERQTPVVLVLGSALAAALAPAGLDLGQLGAAPEPVARELADVSAEVALREIIVSQQTAPNTIGILEGSDPRLRHEYVLFTAHMDHIGVTPGAADSINNGADDDASGTAGVIELAEAFSRPGGRPKRSLIFMTVSGEEKGLWGSHYWSEHPTVPIADVVADINMDMIGRNWTDTIVAIGREHSGLGPMLARVNARHPELRMTAIDDRWPEERFYFRSDHYNFARKGVPILFFFNGVHPDYHRPSDEPARIDADKEARILRLIYYLGREVAGAPQRPKWNPESRAEIVEE